MTSRTSFASRSALHALNTSTTSTMRAVLLLAIVALSGAFQVAVPAMRPSVAAASSSVVMKAKEPPKTEKELRLEAIAKAKAELAAAQAEKEAALAEKASAIKASKAAPALPSIELPKISLPKVEAPSLSLPSVSLPTGLPSLPSGLPSLPSTGAPAKIDLENPAVKGLVAGVAVGALPGVAIISLRQWLASGRYKY